MKNLLLSKHHDVMFNLPHKVYQRVSASLNRKYDEWNIYLHDEKNFTLKGIAYKHGQPRQITVKYL